MVKKKKGINVSIIMILNSTLNDAGKIDNKDLMNLCFYDPEI